MAIQKITTNDSFQTWVGVTNQLIDLIGGSATSGISYAGGPGNVLQIDDTSVIQKVDTDEWLLNAKYSLVGTSGDLFQTAIDNIDFSGTDIEFLSATDFNIYTNVSAGWAARETFRFGSNGTLTVPGISAESFNFTSGGTVSGGDVIIANNLVVGGTITESSDKKLKENITEIDTEEQLDAINSIPAVKYNKIGTDLTEVGLIAQDVQMFIPEVVHEGEDGTLSVAYQRLVPVLMAAVQELTQQVRDLQDKIEELS